MDKFKNILDLLKVHDNYVIDPERKSKEDLLDAISLTESSGGRNTNHEVIDHGIHAGDRAVGNYGLMPKTVQEILKTNPEIRKTNPAANFIEALEKDPTLQRRIAAAYYERLRDNVGNDPAGIAYGWLNGITGAKKAKKRGDDLKEHWHVKKVLKNLKDVE